MIREAVEAEEARLTSTRDPHSCAAQAWIAAVTLSHGLPARIDLHSDGTRYELWVDLMSRAPRTPQDADRVLIAVLNFRAAWHFSAVSMAPYVQEKLTGTSEWDAEVIALFISKLFPALERMRKGD